MTRLTNENANIYAAIAARSTAHPDRVVLETGEGRHHNWQDIERDTARLANAMTTRGLTAGDRVAVQVEKSVQSLFLYLACLRAGLVYVPFNTAYRQAEMAYFLADCEPRLVVCSESVLSHIHAARIRLSVFTLEASGSGSLQQEAAAADDSFDTAMVGSGDLAVIIYTSGTTGRSKGAMLTHGNLLSNATALLACWSLSDRDVLLHALPLFHVHGLFVANHCALLSGARLLFHPKFDAAAVVRDLPRATVMMGVPTYYTRLLAEQGFSRAVCAGMRLFISGSAPLLQETFERFRRNTGHVILERYGMSEAGMITSNPLNGARKGGRVGLPLPGVEVRITDESDRALPPASIGQIQIKGGSVFLGYWRNPKKTAEAFTSDGWFRTGDVGQFDSDGYLSIVGRATDLIITGGYNVYPKEIELVINGIAGVMESAVIGVPDADFGEAVTAIVVQDPSAPAVDETQILTKLKPQLANYKLPKRVYVVAGLPRNAMGKVQKNLLKERFGALRREPAD